MWGYCKAPIKKNCVAYWTASSSPSCLCVCWEAVHSCYSGSNYSILVVHSGPFASPPFHPFIFLLLGALSGQRAEAEC